MSTVSILCVVVAAILSVSLIPAYYLTKQSPDLLDVPRTIWIIKLTPIIVWEMVLLQLTTDVISKISVPIAFLIEILLLIFVLITGSVLVQKTTKKNPV